VTQFLIVEKNFSKAACYYHKHALAQKYTAEILLDICVNRVDCTSPPKSILEIGCGTGFMTSLLFKQFPNANFTIADISSEMLASCKQNTASLRKELGIKAVFKKLNIENKLPPSSFDLIISSLTFQWIEKLGLLMSNLANILNKNGVLLFSTLTDKTFLNLKLIFEDEKLPYPGPLLYSPDSIIKSCDSFTNIHSQKKVYTEHFSSLFSCLKHIQKTGAGNATGTYTNPGKLKNILNKYSKPFDLNYHILFISANSNGDLKCT